MCNELLLVIQLILMYSSVVGLYYYFGIAGICSWAVLATVAMNVEVLLQITAFNTYMTLGNILFATTFVVTDILSEIYGKEQANGCVNVCIVVSLLFTAISQTWLLFTPNEFDFAYSAINTIFSNTPRILLSSLVVFAIVQKFDVWLYHKIWSFNNYGKERLWIRNNVATLVSQFINAFLFTFIAFYGVLDNLVSIALSTFCISVILALLDTPIVYVCRYFRKELF